MSLIEIISTDFKAAYLARELEAKNFLGVLKTEVTRDSKTPEDAKVVAVIKSMIKKAEDTNSLTEDEIKLLVKYLPTQLTDPELIVRISDEIKKQGYAGPKDMGKVMGFLKSNYDGQYDGKKASLIIKNILV
jgi:uncharacterized protein YqeY